MKKTLIVLLIFILAVTSAFASISVGAKAGASFTKLVNREKSSGGSFYNDYKSVKTFGKTNSRGAILEATGDWMFLEEMIGLTANVGVEVGFQNADINNKGKMTSGDTALRFNVDIGPKILYFAYGDFPFGVGLSAGISAGFGKTCSLTGSSFKFGFFGDLELDYNLNNSMLIFGGFYANKMIYDSAFKKTTDKIEGVDVETLRQSVRYKPYFGLKWYLY